MQHTVEESYMRCCWIYFQLQASGALTELGISGGFNASLIYLFYMSIKNIKKKKISLKHRLQSAEEPYHIMHGD